MHDMLFVMLLLAVMKRHAAEIAAIKLCKSAFDRKPNSRSRTLSADKSPDKRDQSSSKDKAREQKDVTSQTVSGNRQTVKRKSASSEDSADGNRRSSLRSSRPQAPPGSRLAASKPGSRKRNDTSTRQSTSSSETDTEINDSSDTEVSQPVKQRKIGISSYFMLVCFLSSCIPNVRTEKSENMYHYISCGFCWTILAVLTGYLFL